MKKVTIVLAVVAVVATASIGMGAIVNYLSNSSVAEFSVDSPFKIEYLDDGDWRRCDQTPLDLGSFTGGDTTSVTAKVTKLGDLDKELSATVRAEFHCPKGITWKDFKQMTLTIYNQDGSTETESWTYGESLPGSGTVNDYRISLEVPTHFVSDETWYKMDLEITFHDYAKGDYDLTLQIV